MSARAAQSSPAAAGTFVAGGLLDPTGVMPPPAMVEPGSLYRAADGTLWKAAGPNQQWMRAKIVTRGAHARAIALVCALSCAIIVNLTMILLYISASAQTGPSGLSLLLTVLGLIGTLPLLIAELRDLRRHVVDRTLPADELISDAHA